MTTTILKSKRSPKGMTLTELILATALVGIVALGAVSIDYAIRNMRNSVYKDSILTASTTNVMEQIRNDANLAIGDNVDRGILTDAAYLCFRINTNDFNNANDDVWSCYSQTGTVIYRCLFTEPADAPGACAANNINRIGTAVANSLTYLFTINNATRDLYLDVSLTNRFPDPAADAHPINNPEYTLDTRIFPASHSF